MKGSDNEFPSVLFGELGAAPATPDAGNWRLFTKNDGLYIVDDAGNVTGPFAESTSAPTFKGARYMSNAAQNIVNNAAAAIVDFEDIDYDTDAFVTTGANWKFTVADDGYYHIDCLVQFAMTAYWAGTERGWLQLYKNNGQLLTLDRVAGYASPYNLLPTLSGSATVHLVATDYIDIRIQQNTGNDIALSNDVMVVWVNIEKVG